MSFFDLTRTSEISVRLRPAYSLSYTEDGVGLQLDTFGKPMPLGPAPAGIDAALPLIADGAPLDVMRSAVLRAAGVQAGAGFLLWVKRLVGMGIIDFPIVANGTVLLTILPQRAGFTPAIACADTEPVAGKMLSRFAAIRRAHDTWLLEHPLIGCRLAIGDAGTLALLMAWASGEPGDNTGNDSAGSLVRRTLEGLGFLDDGPSDDGNTTETLRQWEPHDLAFHFHSRRGFHFDPFGGIFPFIGEIEPLSAIRPSWAGEAVPLERAPEGVNSQALSEVVLKRRSERLYSEGSAVTLRELGIFLDRVASIRSTERVAVFNYQGRTAGMEISRRPYPNGGASYELEIYPVIDVCHGLDRGIYHYDAAQHMLIKIGDWSDRISRMMRDATLSTAGVATPQILFAITARFSRVMWKYKAIAYAVILRNTGALYQTMYLTATDMGLSPCGLGSGDSALFADVTGLDPIVEGTVGEFILGGRPAEAPRPS